MAIQELNSQEVAEVSGAASVSDMIAQQFASANAKPSVRNLIGAQWWQFEFQKRISEEMDSFLANLKKKI